MPSREKAYSCNNTIRDLLLLSTRREIAFVLMAWNWQVIIFKQTYTWRLAESCQQARQTVQINSNWKGKFLRVPVNTKRELSPLGVLSCIACSFSSVYWNWPDNWKYLCSAAEKHEKSFRLTKILMSLKHQSTYDYIFWILKCLLHTSHCLMLKP